MAKREVVDCDGCSRKSMTEFGHITVETRRYMDGAGSMDTDVESVDLCTTCLQRRLMEFVDELSYEDGAKWVSALKKK